MKRADLEKLPKEEQLVITTLKAFRPASLSTVIYVFKAANIPSPETRAREVIWKLKEEGKLTFDDDWFLTPTKEGDREP